MKIQKLKNESSTNLNSGLEFPTKLEILIQRSITKE